MFNKDQSINQSITLQEMLLSLMLFCGKCIKVYVCQKVLKYGLV